MAFLITGNFFQNNAQLFDQNINLNQKNFTQALFKEADTKCNEFIQVKGEQKHYCQRELMIAASCVLLGKANTTMGDLRDNVGDCKAEIDLVQRNLLNNFSDFPINRMNKWLIGLSRSNRSFV